MQDVNKAYDLPGAVTWGACIVGDMFRAAYPLNKAYGLNFPVRSSSQIKADRHLRELGVTIIWLPNFDGKDHDRCGVFGVWVEDFFKQQMPVDFRTTPAFITFFLGD